MNIEAENLNEQQKPQLNIPVVSNWHGLKVEI